MPSRTAFGDMNVKPAEFMAGYVASRKDEILDAVITTAALVARADSWVDPAERRQLIDFLARHRLLPGTRFEVREAFERRVRELREPGGVAASVNRLGRCASRSLARLAVDAGREIAAADHYLDPREMRVLDLIRITLRVDGMSSRDRPPSG